MRALLLSLIAGLFLLPAHAQKKKISLHAVEKMQDSVKHYQKILIVGEGGLQARMYLDNLSKELINDLKTKNIECKYAYLGDRSKTNTEEALTKAETWQHDAVLRFTPLYSAEGQLFQKHPAATPGSDAGNIYHQLLTNEFDISMNEGRGTIWSARLSTVIETGKPSVYKRIKKVILSDMKKQNVLPR